MIRILISALLIALVHEMAYADEEVEEIMRKKLWSSGKLQIGGDGKLPDSVTEWLSKRSQAMNLVALDPSVAPWLAFPSYSRYSLGWRMGPGEDHMGKFKVWFANLNEDQRGEFMHRYPEPADWRGFLETLLE